MDEHPQAKCLFEELPWELRNQIYNECSVNAKLCLKMCCRIFRDGTAGTVRKLYQDLSRTVDFGNARFDRLCLDDTYTGATTNKHVCSACRCLHREEEFTEQQLQLGPTTRVCEASQRRLDLAPGNSFTYRQLLNCRNAPLPLAPPYDDIFTFRPVDGENRQWAIAMDWSFVLQSSLPWTWEVDLKGFLGNFPVMACPHLETHDRQVLEAVVAHWCDRIANPPFATCSACNTKVEFELPAGLGGGGYGWTTELRVSFHVERRVGRLGESAVDPRWKAQSLP